MTSLLAAHPLDPIRALVIAAVLGLCACAALFPDRR
jgi:hypothetical protein